MLALSLSLSHSHSLTFTLPRSLSLAQELAGLVLARSPELYLHAEDAIRGDKATALRVLAAHPDMGRYVTRGLLDDPEVSRLVR